MNKEQLVDLDKNQLAILDKIIKRHIPNKTVWAYGSRVTWKASEISDLDLVVFDCGSTEIADFKEDLEESDLLISVDVMDWENIPDNFKKNISKKYVVLQKKLNLEGWVEVKLGDVVTSNCQSIDKDYAQKTIIYLDTGSITKGKIESLQKLDLLEAPSRAKRLVKDEDIIYSNVRPIQQHYGFIKNPPDNFIVSTGFSVIQTNKLKAVPLLIYYLLTSDSIVERLDMIAEGSTSVYPSLKPSDIEDLEIILPPLPEQKAIAEVLSSLDDKIDLLHRQNKTLEDMAQTLFRQWFIDDAGDDWEEVSLDEIAEYLNGLACQKYPPENEIDKLPVLKIKELRNGISENSDYSTSKVDEKYIVNLGDVIFSWSGSLMIKIWDGQKCVLNQHLFKITSEKYPKWFYYFWTKHHLDKFIGIADSKATTMGHIKRSDISGSMALIPADNILEKMDRKIAPLFEKILLTNKQISPLENLRDTLLPKLMTGQIKVKIK